MLSATFDLTMNGHVLDTSPDAFGELQSSIDLLDDVAAMRNRMSEDGYLFLPDYLDVNQVTDARRAVCEKLDALGVLDPAHPIMDAIPRPKAPQFNGMELSRDNPPLLTLLYEGAMRRFYEKFFRGAMAHFDYTWFRSKSAASEAVSDPHCDVVYMSRGETQNRYTSWTPLGDVPLGMGGLMILEGSHLQEELKASYGCTDVDVYCENIGDAAQIMARAKAENRELTAEEKAEVTWSTMGAYCHSANQTREQVGGRWLTTAFEMGDLLLFTMYTMHTGSDNQTDRLRISTDTRYQPASDAVDERWIGTTPGNWDIRDKQGMVC